MRTLRTTTDVREGMNNKNFKNNNGRTAVIVTVPISKRKQDLGVQFWTNEDMERGFVTNSDSSISKFVELY